MKQIFLLLLLSLLSFYCFSQQSKIDSLLSVLKTAKEDTNKVKTLFQLSEECAEEDILNYAEPALLLSEKLNYKKGIADASNNIGYAYKHKGQIEKALEYYRNSLNMQQEIGNNLGVATSLNNIGSIYDEQGQIEKSLECYIKSLKIQEEIKNKSGIAVTLNNIGSLYKAQDQPEKAMEYYLNALKINEAIGDKLGIGLVLNNIGSIYEKKLELEKALEYYMKSLQIREELRNKRGTSTSLNNIALIYDKQGETEKALEYYVKSLKISEEIGNKKGIALSLNNIGGIYFKQKKYKEAAINCIHSLKIAQEIGSPESIRNASKMLSKIYKEQNNYKDAYDMQVLFKQMSDSINNQETQKASMQYEFAKKEAVAKSEQEKKDAIVEMEKRRQKMFLISVIGGLLLVVIFSVFMFNRWRITQKQKKIIELQKLETDEQRKIIEDKNKDITDSIQYASRIQQTLLTSQRYIGIALTRKFFPTSNEKPAYDKFFIFFKPKDIVSGDFYWAHNIRGMAKDGDYNHLYFACCDCTGHGVPGAFMSLLNISFLNEAVIEKRIHDTSKILDNVRSSLIRSLSSEPNEERKDGMDAALLKIDLNNNMLSASCANNSILIIRNTELIEIEADKMSVGNHPNMHKPFTQHSFQLIEGDTIYLYTDGFADQFGGPKGKKFKYKPLNEKLASISKQPLSEQKAILEKTFEDWKGSLEQVDDLLIVGIKI